MGQEAVHREARTEDEDGSMDALGESHEIMHLDPSSNDGLESAAIVGTHLVESKLPRTAWPPRSSVLMGARRK